MANAVGKVECYIWYIYFPSSLYQTYSTHSEPTRQRPVHQLYINRLQVNI